jgi:hypothetical protein
VYKYHYPEQRAAKDAEGVPRGVAGRAELLNARVVSSQPLVAWDWSPDKEGLAPFEANPRVESHPAFATALNDHAFATVDLAINASDEKERAKARDAIMAASGTLPEILSLFNLKKRGVENFYLAGQKYSLTSYYWSEPTFDNGGYLDTPGGTLTLPSGMQWLRQADSLDYSNGRFELTQSWLGAPSGHWDTILYS